MRLNYLSISLNALPALKAGALYAAIRNTCLFQSGKTFALHSLGSLSSLMPLRTG